jgi:carboxyl-terminal processing protease
MAIFALLICLFLFGAHHDEALGRSSDSQKERKPSRQSLKDWLKSQKAEFVKSICDLDAMIAAHPTDGHLYVEKANLFAKPCAFQSSDPYKERLVIEQGLKVLPDNAELQLASIKIDFSTKHNEKEYLAKLNGLFERNPDYIPAYYDRGWYYLCSHKYAEALTDYTTVIDKSEHQKLADKDYLHRALSLRSECELNLNEYAAAYIDDQKAYESAKNDAYYNFRHGQILFANMKLPQAREAFEKALKLNPEFVLVSTYLGFLDLAEGKYAAAQKSFDYVIYVKHIGRNSRTTPEARVYAYLARKIALSRSTTNKSFQSNPSKDKRLYLKNNVWPGQFALYLQKKINLRKAQNAATTDKQKIELHFLLGLDALSRHEDLMAEEYFQWVRDHGQPYYPETLAARAIKPGSKAVQLNFATVLNSHSNEFREVREVISQAHAQPMISLKPEAASITVAPAARDQEKSPTITKSSALKTIATVDKIVRENFYDKKVVEAVWAKSYAKLLADFEKREKFDEIGMASSLNDLLQKLKTSHCQFVSANDEAFYFLHSLFATLRGAEAKKDPLAAPVACTGFATGGCDYPEDVIRYVLDGSPAAKAGLEVGDRIVSIDKQSYTGYLNISGKAGQQLNLVVDKQAQHKNFIEIALIPTKKEIYPFYIEAMQASKNKIKAGKHTIGYVHLWAGGTPSGEALAEIVSGYMQGVDGLILDLRDGYGGASLQDLDIFYRPPAAYPDLVTVDRAGKEHRERLYFDKPIVALINSGSRSGKELLACSLKASGRAVLVGEKTAGAVVGGRLFNIDRRSSLYLAVVDVRLAPSANKPGIKSETADGLERLEGKGVAPDIVVLNESHNQNGYGLQLKAAIEALEKQLDSQN